MPHALTKTLLHVVFSTKDRQPFLREPGLRNEMHHYIGGILSKLGAQPIIVGGVADHVHVLCVLPRTLTQADLIKETKRSSTLWVKSREPELNLFAWQSGYGIFSIGSSQIEITRDYIARQEEHHKKSTFQDEFRKLLKKYDIAYDERYLWD